MCFSAGVSFGSGVVLSVIGIAAIKKSGTLAQIIFAGIPFIFAVQQITEGFVWLSLMQTNYAFLRQPATYTFLLFAQVLWPAWVPLSMLLLEQDAKRKKLLYALLAAGLLISAYLFYRLMTENIIAQIYGMHILYHVGRQTLFLHYSAIAYCVITILSPFVSSIRRMWLFGLSIAVAYFITHIFFADYELSVWCFFTAIISASVFFILFDLKKNLFQKQSSWGIQHAE